MKKDLQILVIIVCDKNPQQIPNEKDVSRIKKEIEAMEGINEIFVSPKSMSVDMIAFASWEESEIGSKVDKIRELDGVRNVEIKILVPV